MIDPPNQIRLSPSDFARKFLFLEGHQFSFDDCKYILPIYDCPQPAILIMSGRQVAKTTFLAGRSIAHCCTTPYFEVLTVHPTQKQTEEYSHAKMKMMVHNSPLIRKLWFDPKKCKDQVTHVSFLNGTTAEGSSIKLRYCFLNANRVRGMSVNMIEIDEIQDILSDNIPVIQETLTGKRSPIKYQLFAGTPKTYQHSIQKYWEDSTQCEWMIRCDACNYWNVPGMENVKEKGLSCKNCDRLIDPRKGEYISFNPGGAIAGFRVPQIIAPFVNWKYNAAGHYDSLSIWHKYKTYDEGKFYNEVLGLPYEDASKPIGIHDIINACNPDMDLCVHPPSIFKSVPLFAGIDWGNYGPGTTVLLVGGIYKGKLHILLSKRYEGLSNEPKTLVPDIIGICRMFQARMINADFGGGWGPNQEMREELPDRFITTDYALPSGSQRWKYNKKIFSYMVNRTGLMTEVFTAIKKGKIVFPKWELWKPFAQDILNIFVDWNDRRGEIRYDHHPDQPDDTMHALVYLMLAAEMYHESKLVDM